MPNGGFRIKLTTSFVFGTLAKSLLLKSERACSSSKTDFGVLVKPRAIALWLHSLT